MPKVSEMTDAEVFEALRLEEQKETVKAARKKLREIRKEPE